MSETFSKLFEPANIGQVRLKNRIAMAPMETIGMINPDGSLTQRAIDYYVERAKGGVGLIISGLFKVENDIDPLTYGQPLVSSAVLPSFTELSEAVHSFGTKIFVQLTAGYGRTASPSELRGQPVSASAIPNYWDPAIICKELTTEEVEGLVKAFGVAAMIVKLAGIDGIELHGHEGYLFDQFTAAVWNRRADKFGGDLKSRLTFPIETLNIIRKTVGKDFPVQYRFGLKHYIKGTNAKGILPGEEYKEGGRDIDEGLEMAELLQKAGFDALHVDAGCYESWYWPHPPMYQEHGCMVDMAEKVKEVVKVPVLTVGRLGIPELAERIIEEGKADIVALGRALLADPDWPMKVQEGRAEDIRPCLGCHDGCMGRITEGKTLSCAVNPATGRERLYELRPALKSKRVLVAGGGVAGMEAARVAAVMGHKVTLYEKGKSLGGHLIEASVPDFKEDLRRLNNWYKTQLRKLGVEIKLETEVTPELVERENPEEVFVATGSNSIKPDVPGIERSTVVTAMDLLLGRKKAGDSVVVVGGGLIGCETALWLAKQGRKVTIVEMLPEAMVAGLPVPRENRIMLLELLAVNNVNILADTGIQEVTSEGIIIINKTLKRRTIKSDTVVLAVGLKSDDKLYKSLRRKAVHLHALGDCREPRNIMGAIWDSYEVAHVILK
ncbi:MAG: FAD-dependent oxidoreductase [Dehalococcoidia bacterium]|nr:FAD-dependent oxidoreductase [Dehalococcoidia bacterium]